MKYLFSLGVFLLTTAVISPPALAQSSETNSHNTQTTRTTHTSSTTTIFSPFFLFLPISPYTSSSTSTGLTTSGLVGMTISTTRLLLPKGRACPHAVVYLRNNHRDLQEDILLGAGGSIDELAFLMEVPEDEHGQFAEALRDHRQNLLPYLHGELDEEDATAFLTGVLALKG